jgi:hypothetical protein
MTGEKYADQYDHTRFLMAGRGLEQQMRPSGLPGGGTHHGDDLSLNRTKELVHAEVEHRPPLEIRLELHQIEQEIPQGIEEEIEQGIEALEGMLRRTEVEGHQSATPTPPAAPPPPQSADPPLAEAGQRVAINPAAAAALSPIAALHPPRN